MKAWEVLMKETRETWLFDVYCVKNGEILNPGVD